MTKIVLSGYILVPESDLVAVRAALPTHIDATRDEEGCLAFKVEEHATEQGRFDVYEMFVDREAFERHQFRVQASAWGKISQNVERHYEITEVDSCT